MGKVRTSDRRGAGVLVILVLVIVAVIFVFLMFQNFLRGVNAQRESVYGGRRAFYLAESAINEALLDVKAGMNVPGSPWFEIFRVPLSASYGRYERVNFTPTATQQLYDESGVAIDAVSVEFWKQRSFWGLAYEKHGILLVTAVVSIPRYQGGFLDIPIKRNVHKSWEVKVCLQGPPKPFDRMTLYMMGLPFLQGASEDYTDLQSKIDANEKKTESAMDGALDSWEAEAARFVQKAQEGQQKILEARDKAKKIDRSTFGVANAFNKCNKIIEETLAKIGLTEDELDVIARSNPADCKNGCFPCNLKSVEWPDFRKDGNNLANPVYAVKETLSSNDLPLRTPEFPSPPGWDPSSKVPRNCVDWDWPSLTCISQPFQQWYQEYESKLPPYQSAMDSELRRHEGIWKLVPDGDRDKFRIHYCPKVVPGYWQFKAAYRFPDEKAFKDRFVVGGKAFLNGTYFIDGPFRVDFSSYKGKGVIVAQGNVEVGSCSPEGDSTLVVVSGKAAFVSGGPRLAVMAPHETVNFGGSLVNGMVYERYHAWDDFTIKYDPAIEVKEGDGVKDEMLRVSIAPYPLANNFLRK